METQTQTIEQLKVVISDCKTGQAPQKLITVGLGSCVGIALYDAKSKVGGLSHIMLPDSSTFKDQTKWQKFADLAIPQLVADMKEKTGAIRIEAKIAGGASMFSFGGEEKGPKIGERNILAVKKSLAALNIPLKGEHTGGKMGRTMIVDLETFEVTIRMVNREIFIL
ncbi:chemotaxis protein CheD [Lacticigenium naphthae]|uniref:chemotaxis protein CheD n=1 Tax=Lacticigenium naphthae TaxID=515351 RepID=UPI000428421A|nr:chemotaxis protein CheD [Lacticigenium naphthae]